MADLVLAEPDRFIRLPLADAAQLASVSEPTVVRFCRSLGCAGYPDFKLKLAQSLASNQPYLHQEIAPGDTSDEVANKITALSAQTLSEVGLTLTRAVLDPVVHALVKATRIDFYGVGSSGIAALDAHQKFMRRGIETVAHTDPHLQVVSAVTLQPGQVAVCFSRSGAVADIIRTAEIAIQSGARVIAVTRSESPLADVCHEIVPVNTREDTEIYAPMASQLAHLMVVDVLATATAIAIGPRAIDTIRRAKNVAADKRTARSATFDPAKHASARVKKS